MAVVYGFHAFAQYDFFEHGNYEFHTRQTMIHICCIPLIPLREHLYVGDDAVAELKCCTPKGVFCSYFFCGIPSCFMKMPVKDGSRKSFLESKAEEVLNEIALHETQPTATGSEKDALLAK
mmetsp:Transcript_126992/g.179215  ORF Transcript_126992/g.179215 Transcript_126992/m.179215 type:complete len:121 (+) Transcript_126992:103-465(+)